MSIPQQVVVLLANAERGRTLADLLCDADISALPAASSDELRSLLGNRQIDAIVIEQDLRGFLSGIEIVERLHDELLRPRAVVLGNVSPADRTRAERLTIDQFLPESAQMEDIREALRTTLVKTSRMCVAIPQAARSLVRHADFIRPLPQLICKLATYVDNDTASIAGLARDISADPRITAVLLKLTNSASVGLSKKVTRVFDAVNLLGIRRTIALILSDGVLTTQSTMMRALPEEFQLWFHMRSVLIACTASTFARKMHGVCEDTAYVLGLFQEMGILVLAHAFRDRYLQLIERFRTVAQLRLHSTEQQHLGLTHADVSAALMQKWELPMPLVALVAAHHDPARLPFGSPTEQPFIDAMQTGEAIADLHDILSPQRLHVLHRTFERYGSQRVDQCRICMAQGIAKARESSELFKIPLPADGDLNRLRDRLSSAVGVMPANEPLESSGAESGARSADLDAASIAWTTDALAIARPVESGPLDPRTTVGGGDMTILVIDDEPVMIKLVRVYLAPLGIRVVGGGGLDEVRQFLPQVSAILCDVHLQPDNDGIMIVRQLHQAGFGGPILMISSDCTRGTVADSIEAGVVDFIAKPFARDALVEKLRKHLTLPVSAQPVSP